MISFKKYVSLLEEQEAQRLKTTINYLQDKQKVLFLTTSNRSKKVDDKPKSTMLAEYMADEIGKDKVTLLEIPELNIYNCTGNVSLKDGNSCGVKDALLKDNKTKEHVIDEVLDKYEVDKDVFVKDFDDLMYSLKSYKLIVNEN
jgi:hypothetical protein